MRDYKHLAERNKDNPWHDFNVGVLFGAVFSAVVIFALIQELGV